MTAETCPHLGPASAAGPFRLKRLGTDLPDPGDVTRQIPDPVSGCRHSIKATRTGHPATRQNQPVQIDERTSRNPASDQRPPRRQEPTPPAETLPKINPWPLLGIIVVQTYRRWQRTSAEKTYKDAEAVLAEAIRIQEHLAAQDAALTRQDECLAQLIGTPPASVTRTDQR